MRREVLDEYSGRAALRAVSSPRGHRIDLIAALGMISMLLFVAPAAIAQTPRSINFDGISPPAALALLALAAEIPEEIVLSDTAPDHRIPIPILADRSQAEPPILEALLTLRSNVMHLAPAKTTDELLAAAVALGTNPDLEPRNPFRKRSRDLFRTERPVSIGNADMLVRLRLRAKARRAMSVEVRF